MAGRQGKVALDYFELDCRMDEKVKLIRAEYGLKGFAIVVMMYQHIYGGDYGYYCEWDEERLLLFMSENGLIGESKNLIEEVVHACIRRNIFSEELFKKYGILTSSGVQKQYLKAAAKRESVELKKEYLLINVGKNKKNVVINSISGGRNSISDGRNEQSREEKSIEEERREWSPQTETRFNEFCELYPKKFSNILVVNGEYTYLLQTTPSLTEDDLIAAVKNYAESCRIQKTDDKYIAKPENWLKKSYWIDYLPENYKKPDGEKPKNKFNQFPQNDYDFEQLERELLGEGGADGKYEV